MENIAKGFEEKMDLVSYLDALLWQMERDRPSDADCLPNRAGDERRAKAALIQGYLDTLRPIVEILRTKTIS